MTVFVRNRLQLLSSWRAMKNVSTRPEAICERCTSKRDSRCCICPCLLLGFQPQTTWNRQFNRRLPMLKLGTISSFIVLRVLVGLDCLPPTWQSGVWDSLVLRLFSGCDALFLVLSKHLRHNGWYSMT